MFKHTNNTSVGGMLGFSEVNNINQVFKLESGDVTSLVEGQLLEPVQVCFPTSSRTSPL